MIILTRLLILSFILLTLNGYAQVAFEEGYFVNNSGERILCLIKNVDWKDNPTKFQYKLSEDTEPQVATIREVSEFGSGNKYKYERFEVDIDRSSNDLKSLDDKPQLAFQQETLFLKVLVSGQATLYYYEDVNLRRFFVVTDSQAAEQLVYKLYKIQVDKIGENNLYHRQLLDLLECPTISFTDVNNTDYRKDDLIALFVAYNQCQEVDYVTYQGNPTQDRFNLSLRTGINVSSLNVENFFNESISANFGTQTSYRLGVEAEFILPYNRNKWAIVAESSYQPFTSTVQARGGRTATVDYQTLEISAGLKHFFFLNDNNKLFVGGQAAYGFALDSDIKYEGSIQQNIKSSPNLVFAAGYRYRNRYTLEVRYGARRNVMRNYYYWTSSYQSLSLLVGYNLF
jgi:hypothetical protein